jgi:hypothetical protein
VTDIRIKKQTVGAGQVGIDLSGGTVTIGGSVECEVDLFEDDEHGGDVRWWRRHDGAGEFVTTVALCDHHHDGQEQMGVDLRPSHLNKSARDRDTR